MPRKEKASASGAAVILRKSGHSNDILSFSDMIDTGTHRKESKKRARFEPKPTLDLSDEVVLLAPDFATKLDTSFKLLGKKDIKTKMKGLHDIVEALNGISNESSKELKVIRSTVSHWLFIFDNFFYENDYNIRKEAIKIFNSYINLIPKAMTKCIDHWLFQILLFAGDSKKEIWSPAFVVYDKYSSNRVENFQEKILLLLNNSSWERSTHKDVRNIEERSLRLKSTFFRSFQHYYSKSDISDKQQLHQVFHLPIVQKLFNEKDIKIRLSLYSLFTVLQIQQDEELLMFLKYIVKLFVKENEKMCLPWLWKSVLGFILTHKNRFWQQFIRLNFKKSFFPALLKHIEENLYCSKCFTEFVYFISTMPDSIFLSYQNTEGNNDLIDNLFEKIGKSILQFPKKDLLLLVCLSLIKKYISIKEISSTEKLIRYLEMFLELFISVDIKAPNTMIEIFCIILHDSINDINQVILKFNEIMPRSPLTCNVFLIHSLESLNAKKNIESNEFFQAENIVYERISSILQKSRQSDKELEALHKIISLLAKNKYFFNSPVKKQFIVDIYFGIIGTCYSKERVQVMLTTLEYLVALHDIVNYMINLAKSYNRAIFLITCLITYLDVKNKLEMAKKCCLYFLPKVISKTPSNDEFKEALDLFLLLPNRIIIKIILPELCWILMKFVCHRLGPEFLFLPKGHITKKYDELHFNRCVCLLIGILNREALHKDLKIYLVDQKYRFAILMIEASLLGGDIELFYIFSKARYDLFETGTLELDEPTEDMFASLLYNNPHYAAAFLLIRGVQGYCEVIDPIFSQLGDDTNDILQTSYRLFYKATKSSLISIDYIKHLTTVPQYSRLYLLCVSDPVSPLAEFISLVLDDSELYALIVMLTEYTFKSETNELKGCIARLSEFIGYTRKLEGIKVDFSLQVVQCLQVIENLYSKDQVEIASDLFCALSIHQNCTPLEDGINKLFIGPNNQFIDNLPSSVKAVISKSWSREELSNTDANTVLKRKIDNLGFMDFEVDDEVCFQTETDIFLIGVVQEILDNAASNFIVKKLHTDETFLVPIERIQHAHKVGQYVLYLKNMTLIQIMVAKIEKRIVHGITDPPYYDIKLVGSIKFEDIFEGIDIDLITEYDSEIQTLGHYMAPIPSYLIDEQTKSSEYKAKLNELNKKLAEKRLEKDIYGTRKLMLEQQNLIKANRTMSTDERKAEISRRRERVAKRKFLREKSEVEPTAETVKKTEEIVDTKFKEEEKSQLLEHLRKGALISFFTETEEFQVSLYKTLQAFLTFYEQFEFDEISYLQFSAIIFSTFKKNKKSYIQAIALNENMPLIVERYVTEGGPSKKISLITSRALRHMLDYDIDIRSHWVDALCYFSIRVLCSLIDNSGLEESLQVFQICCKLPSLFRDKQWDLDLDGDILFEGFAGYLPRMHLIGGKACLILAIFFGEFFGYHNQKALFVGLKELLKQLKEEFTTLRDFKALSICVILVKSFKGLLQPKFPGEWHKVDEYREKNLEFIATNEYVELCLTSLFVLLLGYENYDKYDIYVDEEDIQMQLTGLGLLSAEFIVRCTGYVIMELLSAAPSLARKWLLHIPNNVFNKGKQTAIMTYVKTHISDKLIKNEFANIRLAVSKGLLKEYEEIDELALNDIEETDELSIIIKKQISIISIVFRKDESTLELDLKMENEFPVSGFDIIVRKQMGINKKKINLWKLQLLTLLNNRVGSLVDCVEVIRENIKKEFSGIDPCVICYMVINMSDNSIPKVSCTTCKSKLHFQCIQKWHKTSNEKVCPVCKQPMNL